MLPTKFWLKWVCTILRNGKSLQNLALKVGLSQKCFQISLVAHYVIYWPSTEPSIKRCTCVNKRKQGGVKQKYNQYTDGLSHLEKRFRSESQRQTEGFEPLVTHGWATQPRWERSAAMVRRTLGQHSSQSLSPVHLSHTTKIILSRIKCERHIFYKKVCLFIHWSLSLFLILFPLIFVYV